MPTDREILNHNLRKKTFGQNFNTIPFRGWDIQFLKFDVKGFTILNNSFEFKILCIKSGRNNLSKDAAADGINIKWYKNANLYF